MKLALVQSINYPAREISHIVLATVAAMREYPTLVPMMDSGPVEILRRSDG